MSALPVAYVVHCIAGRVRVRVPERRGNAAFFEKITRRLQDIPAIISAEAAPATGSILVHFKGGMDQLATSAALLQDEIRLEMRPPPSKPMMQRVHEEVAGIDAVIRDFTNGEVDARALVFCGMLVISAVQVLRGNVGAPAASMLWYTAETARHWRADASTETRGSPRRPG
jgi:Heavy metal associated domain 2